MTNLLVMERYKRAAFGLLFYFDFVGYGALQESSLWAALFI
jgi:hypothetical protein